MFDFHITSPHVDVPALYVPPPKAGIACIGNPRKLPECMAPLTGSMLLEAGVQVIGTIYEPVLDEDEAAQILSGGRWRKTAYFFIHAVTSDLQPGFAELSAEFDKGIWRLRVHLPKTAHYAEVIGMARDTCHAVCRILSKQQVAV